MLLPLLAGGATLDAGVESRVVTLVVLDGDTRHPTPARVEVRDRQGRFYVAEDALRVGGDCKNHETPVARLPLADTLAALQTRVTNPFARSEEFYTTGRSRLALPPGFYDVTASKGPEYRVATRRIAVDPAGPVEIEVPLARWANLPRQGWYSADHHMHIRRTSPELNPHIAKWMQAEDIHVATLLQFGTSERFHGAPQYEFGEAGIYREGDYLLAAGQENPRTSLLGHAIVLGGRSPIHVTDDYLVYQRFWDEAKRQGALSGFAHGHTNGKAVRAGLAVNLPSGLLSFLEVLQFGTGDYQTYYDILNAGLRLTPIAGSDYPCATAWVPGWERFYTKIRGPLTYRSWLDALRAGRTFVTNGPLLRFAVGGKDIGESLMLARPGRVRVEGSVLFDPERDDVEALELVENGRVLRRFGREAGKGEIHFRAADHDVREASWLALRVLGKKVAAFQLDRRPLGQDPLGLDPRFRTFTMAHTAPVFVTIRGRPGQGQHPRAQELAAAWLARLEAIQQALGNDETFGRLAYKDGVGDPLPALQKSRTGLLGAVELAKRYFEERARHGARASPPH